MNFTLASNPLLLRVIADRAINGKVDNSKATYKVIISVEDTSSIIPKRENKRRE